MATALQCPGRIHAILIKDEMAKMEEKPTLLWEIKCRSQRCGARSGVVVLHYFNAETLELIETKIRKEPAMAFSSNKKEA